MLTTMGIFRLFNIVPEVMVDVIAGAELPPGRIDAEDDGLDIVVVGDAVDLPLDEAVLALRRSRPGRKSRPPCPSPRGCARGVLLQRRSPSAEFSPKTSTRRKFKPIEPRNASKSKVSSNRFHTLRGGGGGGSRTTGRRRAGARAVRRQGG